MLEIERELERLEVKMATDASEATLSAYATAQARLEHVGESPRWRDQPRRTIRGLGFGEAELERDLESFSGGELTRASLARALASQPDLLLLDEPTNHLDIESLEWLEEYLGEVDAAVVLVAHDRWFLESVGTSVLELDAGRGRFFAGPWHAWRAEKAARAEPALVASLATRAEERGWDGFFVWDHVEYRAPVSRVADPWITLAAVAVGTSRLVIGPMVTPLARRRPHQLARETVTLDRLSGGRLVLGVGLGSDRTGEFDPARFGEEGDPRERAQAARRGSGEAGRLLGRRVRAAAGVADPDLGRGALAQPPPAPASRAVRRRVPDRPAGPRGAGGAGRRARGRGTATTSSWSSTRATIRRRGPPPARPGA